MAEVVLSLLVLHEADGNMDDHHQLYEPRRSSGNQLTEDDSVEVRSHALP